MRRRSRFSRGARALALAAGLALLAQWGASHTGETAAQWTGSEGGRVVLAAKSITKPTFASCSYDPGVAGVLAAGIIVVWNLPAGEGYSQPTNVSFSLTNNTASTTPTVVTPTPTGTAVTGGFSTRLSLGILSGTLGGSYGITIRTKDSSGWLSPPVSGIATVNLLTLASTCVVT